MSLVWLGNVNKQRASSGAEDKVDKFYDTMTLVLTDLLTEGQRQRGHVNKE